MTDDDIITSEVTLVERTQLETPEWHTDRALTFATAVIANNDGTYPGLYELARVVRRLAISEQDYQTLLAFTSSAPATSLYPAVCKAVTRLLKAQRPL